MGGSGNSRPSFFWKFSGWKILENLEDSGKSAELEKGKLYMFYYII